MYNHSVIARLKPGVTPTQASADLICRASRCSCGPDAPHLPIPHRKLGPFGIGGIARVVLAFWCTPALIRWAPVQISQLQNAGLDWRVVFFVSGICVLAPVLFGLAPALDAANQDIVNRLREGGRSGMQSRRQKSLMSTAVVAQFALAEDSFVLR